MPKMNRVHPDEICKQHVERPNISQIPLQKETDRPGNKIETKINLTNPEITKTSMTNTEDQLNESLITLLNGQQNFQKQ